MRARAAACLCVCLCGESLTAASPSGYGSKNEITVSADFFKAVGVCLFGRLLSIYSVFQLSTVSSLKEVSIYLTAGATPPCCQE